MSCQFRLTGAFSIDSAVPSTDVLQALQEAKQTWTLDECKFEIKLGLPRIAVFHFEAEASAVFAAEVTRTVEAWARRFADWSRAVLRYTVVLDGKISHCLFGPEGRCIEVKVSAIEKRIADLQEEWTDLNFTQLPRASDECVRLVDYTEGV